MYFEIQDETKIFIANKVEIKDLSNTLTQYYIFRILMENTRIYTF